MRFFIGLLLFLPLGGYAFSAADLEKNKPIFKALAKEIETAETELPPCDGLDQVSGAVMKFEPSTAFPMAKAFWEEVMQQERSWRNHCRALSNFTEDQLRSRSFCGLPLRERTALNHKLRQFASKTTGDSEFGFGGSAEEKVHKNYEYDKPGRKEFQRMECVLPVDILFQFRKKQLALAERHRQLANAALEAECKAGQLDEDSENYLRYLREGLSAYEEKK